MINMILLKVLLIFSILPGQMLVYPWLESGIEIQSRIVDIKPPSGYVRESAELGTFAYWMRQLPVKSKGSKVFLHDGREKSNQMAQYRIIDIDTGSKDLQQCADATMRLRAEYLYSIGAYERIHFNFTSGDEASWQEWIKGFRPAEVNGKIVWNIKAKPDSSYSNFKKYLEKVFIYAGSYSLQKETVTVEPADVKIGDIFIQGGFPGHAVIVVDVVVNPENGKKAIMLAQSYMPAQDVHILKRGYLRMTPWYKVKTSGNLKTPEWPFKWKDLRRFTN